MKKIITSVIAVAMALTMLLSSTIIASAEVFDIFNPKSITFSATDTLQSVSNISLTEKNDVFFIKFTPETEKSYEFSLSTTSLSGIDEDEYEIDICDAYLNTVGSTGEKFEKLAVAATLKANTPYMIAVMYAGEKTSANLNLDITEHKHDIFDESAKATGEDDGYHYRYCKYCDELTDRIDEEYPSIDSVNLTTTLYTYNGSVKKPGVRVYDWFGDLIPSSEYDITYPSGRKNVGKYTYTIKFKNHYSGTYKRSFTIRPTATSITSISSPKSKQLYVKWSKKTTQVTGYQMQYSTSSKFSSSATKTVKISKSSTVSKTVSKLSSKKKYYVRVRTYKVVGSSTFYSAWSSTKSVTTKK